MWFFIVLFCLGKAFAQSKGRYYNTPLATMSLLAQREPCSFSPRLRVVAGVAQVGCGVQQAAFPTEVLGAGPFRAHRNSGVRTCLASPSAPKSFLPWVPPPGGPPPPPRHSSSPLPLRGGLPGQRGVFSLSPQPDLVPQLPFPSVATPRPRTPTTEPQPHILSVHLDAPLGCRWLNTPALDSSAATDAPPSAAAKLAYGHPASVRPSTETGLDLMRRQPPPLGPVVWVSRHPSPK